MRGFIILDTDVIACSKCPVFIKSNFLLCSIGMQRSEEFLITESHFVRPAISSNTQAQEILVSCS